MADETLSIGDHVRVIGPAATSPGDTFAIGKEANIVDIRYSDTHQALFACPIHGWGVVNFPATSLQLMRRGWEVALEAQPAQANEPRAIIRHFAAAMERKLAANDAHKGGWRDINRYDLLQMLRAEVMELQDALNDLLHDGMADRPLRRDAVLDEAADVALYAMLIADVCGALPPTDERGR